MLKAYMHVETVQEDYYKSQKQYMKEQQLDYKQFNM